MHDRTVWVELTGSHLDGKPITVRLPVWVAGPAGRSEPLVPTGTVRWAGDIPHEVHVPCSRLDEWHAEHGGDLTDDTLLWGTGRWF